MAKKSPAKKAEKKSVRVAKEPVKKVIKQKKEQTTALGFEDQLWAAADKLRGHMDAAVYKHVVLGLVFLKYVSDAFEERYSQLKSEGDGFEEEKDAYAEK
ncbi:MAG: type I restriction-modification system subunit M N-terminal domain-containing protein, partial [Bacteriovorax sp.]|nr:type I restriction-modification system subunit M N-terminal domain-containing protein [Bacteriovorax sp.]